MRTFFIFMLLALNLQGQTPRGLLPPENRSVQPRADESAPETKTPAPVEKKSEPETPVAVAPGPDTAQPAAEGTMFRYYGHAFVYLTGSSGVRIVINPFSADAEMGYKFPRGLPADVVLISAESVDYSGGQDLQGLPQVFRSLTGIGMNRANGISFHGVSTYRDAREGRLQGGNTVYVVDLDGMKFCHLGGIGHVPDSKQVKEIGPVDVLFLPVGNLDLSVPELWKTADLLKARWIVPVGYKTDKSGSRQLRALGDFDYHGHPVRDVAGQDFTFRASELPPAPSLLILKSP